MKLALDALSAGYSLTQCGSKHDQGYSVEVPFERLQLYYISKWRKSCYFWVDTWISHTALRYHRPSHTPAQGKQEILNSASGLGFAKHATSGRNLADYSDEPLLVNTDSTIFQPRLLPANGISISQGGSEYPCPRLKRRRLKGSIKIEISCYFN